MFANKIVMTNNPKFSIVIPTYSSQALLLECLNALSNQASGDYLFEVVIVNDGGDKQLEQHLTPFRNHYPLRYSYQENKGPATARNHGIEKAKGEIILFLDDDSVPTSNWLEATARAWQEHPDSQGIGGCVLSQPTDNIFSKINAHFFNWYLRYSSQGSHPFLATCNAGYTKSILEKVGSFDETFRKAAGEDRDLNIKITNAGGKLRLDTNIIVYHDMDLTLKTYVKKHYNYGKAAKAIYARYPKFRRMLTTDYLDMYRSIVSESRNLREKSAAFILLTLSQFATLMGYYLVAFSKR
jgi:glycosyltransferase involved in cell wall biosynthesis